jgi:hypothetical protein
LKKTVSIFVALVAICLYSCKKDPGVPFDMGYNYFPDQVGKYVVYNVDSIYYNSFYSPSRKDTFKFQIKEKIESIFTDNEGRPAMRLERYVKYYDKNVPYSEMEWQLRDVWMQNRTVKNAEKIEENVRYLKLIFPLNKDVTWNGNAYNTEPEERYKYNFIDLPRTIGNIHFDSVLQVDQHNETNLIISKIYEEKYARNVGMIYKRVVNVDSQYPTSWNSNPFISDSLAIFYNTDILKRASSGYQYTMTITTYGTE